MPTETPLNDAAIRAIRVACEDLGFKDVPAKRADGVPAAIAVDFFLGNLKRTLECLSEGLAHARSVAEPGNEKHYIALASQKEPSSFVNGGDGGSNGGGGQQSSGGGAGDGSNHVDRAAEASHQEAAARSSLAATASSYAQSSAPVAAAQASALASNQNSEKSSVQESDRPKAEMRSELSGPTSAPIAASSRSESNASGTHLASIASNSVSPSENSCQNNSSALARMPVSGKGTDATRQEPGLRANSDVQSTVSTAISCVQFGLEAAGAIAKTTVGPVKTVAFVANAVSASEAYDSSKSPGGFVWEMTKGFAAGAAGTAAAGVAVAGGMAVALPPIAIIVASASIGIVITNAASSALSALDDIDKTAIDHASSVYQSLDYEIRRLYGMP